MRKAKKPSDPSLSLLRHTVATLAYRAGKAVRGAPESFAEFQAAPDVRTPAQILAHMGDLFDWALSIARGKEKWNNPAPLAWHAEVERFFAALKAFDDYLASGKKVHAPVERLFQGPVADALQHTGQLTVLRRVAGTPIRAENYSKAEIVAGRVGNEQTVPKREF
ncbi:MAG TPA: hypothetical protein VKG84_14470 [Candidatus Acidoferrales bacterium]|nr:hypothetical protein [Candidatus Acidoferrales bacterium]